MGLAGEDDRLLMFQSIRIRATYRWTGNCHYTCRHAGALHRRREELQARCQAATIARALRPAKEDRQALSRSLRPSDGE